MLTVCCYSLANSETSIEIPFESRILYVGFNEYVQLFVEVNEMFRTRKRTFKIIKTGESFDYKAKYIGTVFSHISYVHIYEIPTST